MGLGKIGLNIGKEIIAWTRAGSRSMLATRPIKINVAELKYKPLKTDTFNLRSCKITSTKKAGTVLNESTGLQESIIFSDLPKEISRHKVYDITAYNTNGEEIGRAGFKQIERFKKPNSLKINYIGTSKGYKGIGTEIVRKLVKLSNELGMQGRILLEACTGSVPPSYRFSGFSEKCKVSAAIKYKKMGFVAESKFVDKRISNEIADGGSGIRLLSNAFGDYTKDIFSGELMHLSDNAIKKFLK